MYPSPIHEEHHGRSWGPMERGPNEQRGRTLSPALERAFTQPSLHGGSLERASHASNGQNLSLERGYNQSSVLERGSHSNSSTLERGPYQSTSLERGQNHLERGPYPASSLERGSKMSNSLERGPKNNASSLERSTKSTNPTERGGKNKNSLSSNTSLERSSNHITEGESNHSKEKGRTQSPPSPAGVSPAPSGGKTGDDTQSILSLTLR